MLDSDDLRNKASIPSETPHAHTLPLSNQVALSTNSSETDIPPYDSHEPSPIIADPKPKQAGAFALARKPSVDQTSAKHLEEGHDDTDSSLNVLGERTLTWQKTSILL